MPENSGRVRLAAQLGAVPLDHVAQQYARSTSSWAQIICGPTCASRSGDADGE